MSLRRTKADVESARRIRVIEEAATTIDYKNYDDLVSALLAPEMVSNVWEPDPEAVARIRAAVEGAIEDGTTPGEFLAAVGNILRYAGGHIVRDERQERNAKEDSNGD